MTPTHPLHAKSTGCTPQKEQQPVTNPVCTRAACTWARSRCVSSTQPGAARGHIGRVQRSSSRADEENEPSTGVWLQVQVALHLPLQQRQSNGPLVRAGTRSHTHNAQWLVKKRGMQAHVSQAPLGPSALSRPPPRRLEILPHDLCTASWSSSELDPLGLFASRPGSCWRKVLQHDAMDAM
jgi:hypothetical protein